MQKVTPTAPQLPVEGRMPSFDGATAWLNSPPLTPAGLRGKVVLVDFWTYTCINWLRQLPYVRAWAEKYAGQGLVVIGVHTPEFGFEHNVENVRRAVTGHEGRATRSRSTTTMRYGMPSTTTTGRPSTSSTRRAVSGITTSARATTSSRR